MSIGLTPRMRAAYDSVLAFVARHGVTPSLIQLEDEMRCAHGNASRLMGCLVERGHLHRRKGGELGIGGGQVSVTIPPHLAARVAEHCIKEGERFDDVIADAVTLHLDALAGIDPCACSGGD